MRQAPRSSSATLAKYTGWVTALGRRAGETGAKRIAGARDERRLLTLQRTLFHLGLLIIDEMGFVPLSPHQGGTAPRGLQPALLARVHLVTTNLPFDE